MVERTSTEDTLMRLAQVGAASHLLRFPDDLSAAASLDDEVAALEALAELVDGPIYRIDALTYAVACDGDLDELAAALVEKLGAPARPEISALPTPVQPPRDVDRLLLLGALEHVAEAPAAARSLALDARFAASVAAATAARINELVETVAGRDEDASAAAEARLDRIDRVLAEIGAKLEASPAPVSENAALAARLDRIEAALEKTASRERSSETGPALARLEAAVATLSARPEDADFAADRMERAEAGIASSIAHALGERLDALQAGIDAAGGAAADRTALRIDALAERLDATAAAHDVENLRAAVEALRGTLEATPAAPALDLRRERECFARLTFGLQTVAARLEAKTELLSAADRDRPLDGEIVERALATALAPITERFERFSRGFERLESAADVRDEHDAVLMDMVRAVRDECAALRSASAAFADRVDEAGDAEAVAESIMERLSATLAEFLARLDCAGAVRIAPPKLAAPRIGAV